MRNVLVVVFATAIPVNANAFPGMREKHALERRVQMTAQATVAANTSTILLMLQVLLTTKRVTFIHKRLTASSAIMDGIRGKRPDAFVILNMVMLIVQSECARTELI
jgi:hypothetical protein